MLHISTQVLIVALVASGLLGFNIAMLFTWWMQIRERRVLADIASMQTWNNPVH